MEATLVRLVRRRANGRTVRDIKTGELAPLFHPRRHKWTRHFRWDGPKLIGKTPIGRVTIEILNINEPLRVELRRELVAEGDLD